MIYDFNRIFYNDKSINFWWWWWWINLEYLNVESICYLVDSTAHKMYIFENEKCKHSV